MRSTYSLQTMLFGFVLPLWLISFVFGRSSAALVDTAQSQTLAQHRADVRRVAERRGELDLNVNKLMRNRLGSSRSDPFGAPVPKRAAAPVLPPPPPPAPVAPPFPFVFIGRYVENNSTVLFLSKQDRAYSVKIHDEIDNLYRVDKIENEQAVITYIPLNIQQTLSFKRAS